MTTNGEQRDAIREASQYLESLGEDAVMALLAQQEAEELSGADTLSVEADALPIHEAASGAVVGAMALGDEALEDDAEPTVPARAEIHPVPSYCTRTCDGICERCALVCPHDAITLETSAVDENRMQPVINRDLCTNCGLCRGVCDAFSSMSITLLDLFERAKHIAKTNDAVVFTCNSHLFPGFEPHSSVIVLPCLASVPPEFWAALLALGIEVFIYRDEAYCDTCEVAGPQVKGLSNHAFVTAQQWTGNALFEIEELPEEGTLVDRYAKTGDSNFNRRGIFSSFTSEMEAIASGKYRQRNNKALDIYMANREESKARGHILHDGGTKGLIGQISNLKRMWPRKQVLRDGLEHVPEMAAHIPCFYSCTDADLCKSCGLCVEACPTGARSMADGVVVVDKPYCVACGVCLEVCEYEACDYEEGTAASLLSERE